MEDNKQISNLMSYYELKFFEHVEKKRTKRMLLAHKNIGKKKTTPDLK